jgi:4-carboxymuconolactone decarboxylase
MVSTRVADVRYEELNAEQKRMYDVIAGTRKSGLGGPFSVLVRIPHVAEPANGLHNAFRLNGKLDRRIFEMLILMVAREYTAEFAWVVHEALALKAGLAPAIITAVRERRVPDFTRADERLTYDLVTQLLHTKALNDAAYQRGIDALGLDLMVELVSAVGFYSMVCLVLNSFAVPAFDNSTPLASAGR